MSNRKKSAEVWGARYRNAAKLAKCDYFNGDEDAALNLILRTIRWSLRRAHQWERANNYEKYGNSRQAAHDEDVICKFGEKLNAEYKKCGLEIKFYGLYPTITKLDDDGGDSVINLDYFD